MLGAFALVSSRTSCTSKSSLVQNGTKGKSSSSNSIRRCSLCVHWTQTCACSLFKNPPSPHPYVVAFPWWCFHFASVSFWTGDAQQLVKQDKVRGEQLLEELTGEAWTPLGDIFHVTVHSARNLCHHMVRQPWQSCSKAESAGTLQLPSSLLSLLFGCLAASGVLLSPLLPHGHAELSSVPDYLRSLSLGWMVLFWAPF